MPPRRKAADPTTAITYLRVSTEEQADSGLGLAAQRTKVNAECERHGWTIVHEALDDGYSAKSIAGRPDLTDTLAALERGEAGNLVAAKLDRLSRSVHDFTEIIDLSVRQGWNLVVLDLGLDTSTPNGKFMAHVLAAVAQLERELIAERTSNALQAKKAQGAVLGRPDRHAADLVERIVRMRSDDSMTLRDIASQLSADRVPTSQGGTKWHASTVAAILRRDDARAMQEQS